jgi:hypothetical protein
LEAEASWDHKGSAVQYKMEEEEEEKRKMWRWKYIFIIRRRTSWSSKRKWCFGINF